MSIPTIFKTLPKPKAIASSNGIKIQYTIKRNVMSFPFIISYLLNNETIIFHKYFNFLNTLPLRRSPNAR